MNQLDSGSISISMDKVKIFIYEKVILRIIFVIKAILTV